ncbi:50S ribosomal protein L23 [Candidatus Jorgensenbacteria bacterium GWA1_49_17]|uniref:Large ribosomal subunit protein uL23 n=2 Tax=Candidatus Joergenseniibacteriota TaxID=1752739 RepID=A0A1F6BQ52_9BACT|nr:MAG: 50S ribosomal protein L23 [Candidatus Jorgensenbacteria bacterium GWC1_48_12]OGG40489.1 MAG: 50S ribosomal protein L23 [Candidatus Jorgensenbacteria bacterium GWA1_49_17]
MKMVKKNWVSEKATDLQKKNQYVFLVQEEANKSEVKKEISRKYGVKIKSVNMVSIKGKMKRYMRTLGRKPAVKKAIVTLKPGEKLEIA